MIFSEKSETPNLTDYLKAKPDSVVYYGDKKSTASWQLLYFIALKLIAAKHPDELMCLERKSILGDKIEIGSEIEIREFSHPLGIMRKPDGKWLFAETDFNVQQILLRLKKLMEICKDPLDTMVIYFSTNQSQNVSLHTDKSDSPMIRKSLAEIFRPEIPKATPTVTTAEQQYVQWLIQKGEKPSEAQAAFSMTEKVINRLQISAKRLFSVTSAVELKYILSALRRTPQWHYFSSRQQNQIVHTIDLYREFRESSAKALANAQAASTVQPPATTSTSHPSVLPAPALSGSQKISSPEKFSCAGANPLEVLFDGKHIEAKTWKSGITTPRDTEVIAAIDALQNEKARVLTDAQKVYAALYETVGSEYVTYFKVHRPELLAKLKLSHGNDMSTWEAPELSRLQSMMKSAIQQQARQEKLQNTKNEIAEMPVSRLRENIASFLDSHPEYCDEFLK